MSKTAAINPNRPASTGETPRLGDNVIRTLAAAIAEQQAVDHYMGTDSGSGYTSDDAGQHKKITFYGPLSAKPTAAANKSFLYSKDVSNKTELFWEDEDGDELQLTSGGVFNPAIACGITGNQSIAGIKTFSGACIFGDGSALVTSAAPDADAKLANKKYVDDELTDHASDTAIQTSGATVHSGALTANTWTALDLSGTVGANRAMVTLKVSAAAATAWRWGITETGALTYHSGYVGFDSVTLSAAGDVGYVVAMTHSDGTLVHAASNTQIVTIALVAYKI